MTVRSDVDLYKSSRLSPSLSSPPLHANASKEAPARYDVTRRIDMAGQGWPSDSRNGLCYFINFPKEANTYDQQRDYELRNCIIEAIPWYLDCAQLTGCPAHEKRIALRFVAHLVGDIHQRCTSPGRRPGGEGEYGPGQ